MLDDDGPQHKGKIKDTQKSGSLYGFVPPSKAVNKGPGVWNRYEITCKGNLVSVVFNGEKVVEGDMSKFPELDKRPRKGFIGSSTTGPSGGYGGLCPYMRRPRSARRGRAWVHTAANAAT